MKILVIGRAGFIGSNLAIELESASIANHAAGIKVGKIGTATISIEKIRGTK